MKFRLILWFLLAQVVVCGFVFRDALWGGSLLAPLDIAPALFSKYQYLDPASSGIPANHYTIDQLTYNLPIQHTIYESLRQGEIPWWDPYALCGRPLLADATVNGADPLRWLLYLTLPFETAYNWTRILHFFLTGLGMLLFLHRWGFRDWQCLLLSLTYQFAGCFVIYFGHAWIQSSFTYYPFLWLAWEHAVKKNLWRGGVLAALLVAGAFYAGNVQSHAYLVLFGLAFGFGHAVCSWAQWRKILPLLAGTGLLGACLAAPVLGAELEFYSISVRKSIDVFDRYHTLAGLGSFSAFFPWCLGTFRSIDLSKAVAESPLGFALFTGSAAFVLAALGAWLPCPRPEWRPLKRTAIFMGAAYLLVISTPLVNYLYMRCAGLAVMGLIVLAAFALESLGQTRLLFRKAGKIALALTITVLVLTNGFALLVFPRVETKLKAAFLERMQTRNSLDLTPQLRTFQVENLPHEISLQNPETVTAALGVLVLVWMLLGPPLRRRVPLCCALLVLNLVPVLLFAQRFIPRQPMTMWRALLAGGPEQQRVMAVMRDTPLRLQEISPGPFESVFPRSMGHLYHVRTVHGDSSLFAPSLFNIEPAEREKLKVHLADWIYESPGRGQATGDFHRATANSPVRLQWQGAAPRPFTSEQRGLKTIRLTFAPGGAGSLLLTDTYYPGWRAVLDGKPVPLTRQDHVLSKFEIPAGARVLTLSYEPRSLAAGKILCGAGLVLTLAALLAGRRKAVLVETRAVPRTSAS